MSKFPHPPFKTPQQDIPGATDAMNPRPDHGEDSYKGGARLANKKALITGADSGIGRAVALAFAREGADVAVAYLSEHRDAEDTKRLVEDAGRTCILLPGDLAIAEHCRAVVARTIDAFDRIDIL